ncbi:prolyl oligopeptidase family serine peptidase [Nocardioides insulae]|uniref:prolyl oligopeptidase family serine peptidase n=1 Tax=Nocardioides insulae TaxID=394734 RepID=UPI000686BC18|nr:prolyl oligopeptidase family serine peptidase [Nocardioides insulae]
MTPSEPVATWLLDHGYALAGSQPTTQGWAVEDLLREQEEVTDVVARELGRPQHVVAWGNSMGGLTSAALLEAHPDSFDAALPMCGSIAGAVPMLNQSLDATFVFKTLLAPDDDRLELTDVQDEVGRQAAFAEVLEKAQRTPEGRARISLAASIAQIPTWTQVDTSRPARGDLAAQQHQQYAAFLWGAVSPRQPLEERAGGNFSWNTGVDYARQLAGSGTSTLVRRLYAEAGLDLRDELALLAAAPRVSADPDAVDYMQRNATPTGELNGPILSVHEAGDTAPTVGHARTFADRVHRHRDGALLRRAFVDRPGHCDYSDAEIAALVSTLQDRLASGRWGSSTQPGNLDRLADRIAGSSDLNRGTGHFDTVHPRAMLRPERGLPGGGAR